MNAALRCFLAFLLLIFSLPPSAFAQSENKTGLAVLMDNTGSNRPQFHNLQMLGKAVVEESGKQDLISVFNFETRADSKKAFAVVTRGTKWSQNKYEARSHIEELWVVPGLTTLYDAIDSIAATVNAEAAADRFAEKRIVLITDGEDRASKIKKKELIEKLKREGFKIYAFGMVEDLENRAGAIDFLKKITRETGGKVIFPKRKQKQLAADLVKELFAQ